MPFAIMPNVNGLIPREPKRVSIALLPFKEIFSKRGKEIKWLKWFIRKTWWKRFLFKFGALRKRTLPYPSLWKPKGC